MPPAIRARTYTRVSDKGKPPSRASATDTTGLKCAPEIGPKVRIRATSVAPVAIVLANNANATFPFARRSAMMPEPTTVATRSKVPKNSAVHRLRRFGFTGLTDPTTILLNCELVQASKGEAQEETDSPVESHASVSKGAYHSIY